MPLTRPQAAEKLGISQRRLRDLERDKRLVPMGKRGKARTFTDEQVDAFARSRRAKAPAVAKGNGKAVADGMTAAEVFRMFEATQTKVQIVIALAVAPELVETLWSQYQEMRREVCGENNAPQCRKCRHKPARFCGGCLDD